MKDINNVTEVKLDRRVVSIKPNEYVTFNNDIYQITQVVDFNTVIGINVNTNKTKILPVHSLSVASPENVISNDYIHRDLADITDDKWREMEHRLNSIRPLLEGKARKEIVEHSEKIGIHYTTLYRWLKKYQTTGTLAGLMSNQSGCKKGTTRISQEQELLIQEIIVNHYLQKQKIPPTEVIELVKIECKKRNIPNVGNSTVRNRIGKISTYNAMAKREGRGKAQNKFSSAAGSFPNADFPLAIVQIDHTPADIIIVDDETRKPIGRPWLTLAIDIHSRVVTGYYLSLDAPSTTSVAMCIANSILPKDKLLLMTNVEADWSVWGVMQTIHVDNGADFRASTLTQSCLNYDINLEFRPVGKSHFGGHIERLLGSFSKKIHTLSGSTFSNVKERDTYDSDKHSSMTFSEFETWLVTYITKVYHKSIHSSLGMTPEQKWHDGIMGTDDTTGVGYQVKLTNAETLLIDFLPISQRTVQRNGINIDGLHYYDNILRSWINSIDEETQKKRKFTIRQDPRDISYLWFYEPSVQSYYKIPLANQAIPSMSQWEYRQTREKLKQEGLAGFNEANLLDALDELNQLAEKSISSSKKARRKKQNKKNNELVQQLHQPPVTARINIDDENDVDGLWSENIKPFDNEGEY
jgi:putative transposase